MLFYRYGFANLRRAQTSSSAAFYAGALAACSGLFLHSVVDFNLHIPSNALLFSLLALRGSAPVQEEKFAGDLAGSRTHAKAPSG
jgi:hypothetical protein